MAQDDTAEHWREKSLMKAILDEADGEIELVRNVTLGVPVRLVEEWFGFRDGDRDDMIEWSYWNQPFDRPFLDDPDRILRERKKSIFKMLLYLARPVAARSVAVKLTGAGHDDDDPVSRLLRMRAGGA